MRDYGHEFLMREEISKIIALLAKNHEQIIVWNFIIKFTRSNTCCIFKTSGKKYSGSPDNKKEIYINEIVKKQNIYPMRT
jgi:hypothetical protein